MMRFAIVIVFCLGLSFLSGQSIDTFQSFFNKTWKYKAIQELGNHCDHIESGACHDECNSMISIIEGIKSEFLEDLLSHINKSIDDEVELLYYGQLFTNYETFQLYDFFILSSSIFDEYYVVKHLRGTDYVILDKIEKEKIGRLNRRYFSKGLLKSNDRYCGHHWGFITKFTCEADLNSIDYEFDFILCTSFEFFHQIMAELRLRSKSLKLDNSSTY